MNVLLVAGSRSLTSRGAWCQRSVEAILRELVGSADLVVAGDAVGPDRWAMLAAHSRELDLERWTISGYVQRERDSSSWSPLKTNDPLVRNRTMVEHVRDHYLRRGENVLCVGFVDPVPRTADGRRTRGTDHTLRLARQAGIWTARYVWQGERFEEQS